MNNPTKIPGTIAVGLVIGLLRAETNNQFIWNRLTSMRTRHKAKESSKLSLNQINEGDLTVTDENCITNKALVLLKLIVSQEF